MVDAENPWICRCELGADVSWNAVAGCALRLERALLAVECSGRLRDGRRTCRACGICGAVSRGLLVGMSRQVSLCHGLLGSAHVLSVGRVFELLTRTWSEWRVIEIADKGVSRWRRVIGIAD